MKKSISYFPEYGESNTADLIDVVRERLAEGGIEALVVASTSGKTALSLARKVRPESDAPIVCVSDPPWAKYYPGITQENRQALEELQVEIVDRVPYASHSHSVGPCKNMYGAPDLRVMIFDAFRLIGGQGLKVAMEVGMMATDGGRVKPGAHILCVGGTGTGADCAIVMKAGFSVDLLSRDRDKRPHAREILAMPLDKKWRW
ncbi:MAG: hypothetical protein WBB22_09355 [Anaerolineae bacterium]